MKITLYDAHTHAHFPAFDADRAEMLLRAREAGIGMINVGTSKEASASAIMLAESGEGLWATVGLHPIHTSPSFHDKDEGEETAEEIFDYDFYKTLALHPKVVAIGECGLDYFRITGDEEAYKTRQREAFKAQMRLAHEAGKPLMIHCRSAYPDLLRILDEEKGFLNAAPGVSHFFAGNAEEARALLEMGFSFTFGGAITLPKRAGGTDYEEIIALMPEDRILVETDAPYVAPLLYRGKRNEPAYVVHVVKRLAELRGVSYDRMAEITRENTEKVFNIGK